MCVCVCMCVFVCVRACMRACSVFSVNVDICVDRGCIARMCQMFQCYDFFLKFHVYVFNELSLRHIPFFLLLLKTWPVNVLVHVSFYSLKSFVKM